ncbi:MAG: L,D-transpeptidase [bacterium]
MTYGGIRWTRLKEFAPAAAMIAAMIAAAVTAATIPHAPPAEKPVTAPAPAAQPEAKPEEAPSTDVSIEVNIPATELTLFEGGGPLFRRKVAIGQGVYPTPEQESFIKRVEWNPWWFPPPNAPWARGAKPTPPGPGNPLGMVKMPLSEEILFHGTNKEWSVGRAASHGCMRMLNRDATELAWYLQERFSEKRDPALRDLYAKNRGTTYRVELTTPVPVTIVYRPVLARNDLLTFYPDHYNRVAGRHKAAIITELLRAGYEIDGLDEVLVDRLAGSWPQGVEVPIEKLMRMRPPPDLSEAAICD